MLPGRRRRPRNVIERRYGREFNSLVIYLASGTVPVGSQHATYPVLRSYELLLAAVLMAPQGARTGFLARAEVGRADWDTLTNQYWELAATADQPVISSVPFKRNR